jgi:molecular chaperone HscB
MPNSESKPTLLTVGETTSVCWSCGTMPAEHFCDACGKVQPATPVDYFTFFGLPRKLNLDTALLEREFYALSRKLHPDLYARADSREKEWSLEQSSKLNDAYRTLKDPIKRTQYLLRLEGVELEEQSKSATEKARGSGQIKKQVVPAELLEEVFEINMQLEELRINKKAGDHSRISGDLEAQKAHLEQVLETLFIELASYWREWDRLVDSGTEDQRAAICQKMVQLLNRRNYVRNLVEEVNAVLEA